MTNRNIEHQAKRWFVELRSESFSMARWDAFEEWLCTSREHEKAYQRVSDTWAKAVHVSRRQLQPRMTDSDVVAIARPMSMANGKYLMSRNGERRFAPHLARAVALAVGIACLSWIPYGSFQHGSYGTAVGQRAEITLRDGTRIVLNTDTRLDTRLTSSVREVTLRQGEALFHVTHDQKRPFTVRVDGSVITDVGTEFSVRLREARHFELVVAEGVVRISGPSAADVVDVPATLSASPAEFSAGHLVKASWDSRDHLIVQANPIAVDEVERKLAWTKDRVRFNGETLEEAVAEFNRYNRLKLVVADPTIADLTMGGDFDTREPESFLRALIISFPVKAQREGPDTILLFKDPSRTRSVPRRRMR